MRFIEEEETNLIVVVVWLLVAGKTHQNGGLQQKRRKKEEIGKEECTGKRVWNQVYMTHSKICTLAQSYG
jgi:hypothetical protein